VCGIQDTPPGTAVASVAARLDLDGRPDLSSLLLTWTLRGAPHYVPPGDHALFTLGVLPEAADPAVAEVESIMVDALRKGPRPKGEVSAFVNQRAPELSPYCRACDAHHPNDNVFRAAALKGRFVLQGTAPVVLARARPAAKGNAEALRTELLLRYLHAYAPTTASHFATWAGIDPADAKRRWTAVADAVVKVGKGFVLEEDLDELERPRPVTGARLVPNKDALLQARDRDLLFLDPAHRKKVFPMLGGPGVVLLDAEPVATWRAAAKGKRLEVTVEPFLGLPKRRHAELDAEAQRLAAARGQDVASVTIG